MKLSKAQLEQYHRDGYLVFPELFSPDEVAIMRREVSRVSKIESEMVVREGESRVPKAMLHKIPRQR